MGFSLQAMSRSKPPKVAAITPIITAGRAGQSSCSAIWVPVALKMPRPIASATRITRLENSRDDSRSVRLPSKAMASTPQSRLLFFTQ